MKHCNLSQLCSDEEWPEVRKYLSSDAAEVEKRSNIMYRNDHGTCLHAACCHGAPDDIVEAMIVIGGKELITKVDIDDGTVLHSACFHGASYFIIRILILVGGKDLIMAKDEGGDTALHWLCYNSNDHHDADDKIKLILQVGDVDLLLATHNHDGKTPLEIATDQQGASNKIMKLLAVQSIHNSTRSDNNAIGIPTDNCNNSTTITRSNYEEQHNASNSSANTNNGQKYTSHQTLQRLLKESQGQTQNMKQEYDQKCKDYSDLEKSMRELKKKSQAQGEEIISLMAEQKEKGETDNRYWKHKADHSTQTWSEHKAKLQKLENVASAPVAGIQMTKKEEVDDSAFEISN